MEALIGERLLLFPVELGTLGTQPAAIGASKLLGDCYLDGMTAAREDSRLYQAIDPADESQFHRYAHVHALHGLIIASGMLGSNGAVQSVRGVGRQ